MFVCAGSVHIARGRNCMCVILSAHQGLVAKIHENVQNVCCAHHCNDLTCYQDWHSCVQTLESVHTHVHAILNQWHWELKVITNHLVNANAEEHILPFAATPYH